MKKNILKFIVIPVFLITVLWFLVFKGWQLDFSVPVIYDGRDDFLHCSYIKKAIISDYRIWENNHLGFPFHHQVYAFPLLPFTAIFFSYIVGIFTDNFGLVTNLYIISTYVLSGLTFIYVCKKFKITYNLSLLGCILYSFCQFHYLHSWHMTAISYFMVPLFVLLCYYVYSGKYKMNYKFVLFCLLVCYIGASADPFYAFFACFLLLVCSLRALGEDRIKDLFLGFFFIISIASSMLINLLPSILFQLQNPNGEKVTRLALDASNFGLKFITLIIPAISGHPLTFIKNMYLRNGFKFDENLDNYLGVYAICGFIVLILYLISYKKLNQLLHEKAEYIQFLSIINLFSLMLGVAGGVGLAFAILVTAQVRTYNRIFVFIYFCSLVTFLILIEKFYEKYVKSIQIAIIILLITIHLYDIQTRKMDYNYAERNEMFYSDKNLVIATEKSIGSNGAVLNLPYLPFPENVTDTGKTNYLRQMNGWFHSNSLYWSVGLMYGSIEDKVMNVRYNASTYEEILNNAIIDGFDGILIDKNACNNDNDLVEAFQHLIGKEPLISQDESQYFFNIQGIDQSNIKPSLTLVTGAGFYRRENLETTYWNWAEKNAELVVYNPDKQNLVCSIEFSAQAIKEGTSLNITSENLELDLSLTETPQSYVIQMELVPGINKIEMVSDSENQSVANDIRLLNFRINNYVVKY